VQWSARANRRALLAAPIAVVGTVGWFWVDSFYSSTYSVMDTGYVDLGGGPDGMANMPGMPEVSVANLTGPATGPPDISLTLVARKETITLASGQKVDGYTLNHTSPGPAIRAVAGDVLEVTLVNASVPDGVTLHWHGIDVPNAFDGVAGVTQDAVPVGGSFVYKFRLDDAGTYWYHSHQHSLEQVPGGIFGALIVAPAPAPTSTPAPQEIDAVLHTYGSWRTINVVVGRQRIDAPAGSAVRVRVVNTDIVPLAVAVTGAAYRVVAHDGRDITGPTDLTDTSVVVAAGGRIDVGVTVPEDGSAVLVDLDGGAQLAVGPPGAALPRPSGTVYGMLDLLAYGSPAPIGFEPANAVRRFEYRIGRRFGFEDGEPGEWWTVNGHKFPDMPMFEVDEGDIVVMTISNTSGIHPIHLHGHHGVVLSRDGVPATGSPWLFDTLNVETGSTYVTAFVADNPGIWMDHCHNLKHAVDGLVVHLAYSGVAEPYVMGGPAHNHPA
jgi:FtsP/CotA-like multicopper oxidase with cupredoxin domain